MSNYTLKERMVAKMLSKFPKLKNEIKKIYSLINYIIYKKKYKILLNNDKIEKFNKVVNDNHLESFFGYYDKYPMNKDGWVISNVSKRATFLGVQKNSNIEVILTNIFTKEEIVVGKTNSYNWQQGCRAHWLNNNLVIFNTFDDNRKKFISKVFSLSQKKIVKEYNLPVQDSFNNNFFLSLNYQRLQTLTIDYGYNNLPKLSKKELMDIDNDGIYYLDCETNESKLLFSLKDIMNCNYNTKFDNSFHSVNHIMINPEGKSFIFIHRYYLNNVRHDRLMFSDFNSIKVLVDEKIVSHCCWIKNDLILGYLRFNNNDKYFEINVNSGTIKENLIVSSLNLGDGHPNGNDDFIVFDTYPNKSRIQTLYLNDRKNSVNYKLIEVFHSMKFIDASRCDMHPRSEKNSKYIFFDSVFNSDKRHQYYIKFK